MEAASVYLADRSGPSKVQEVADMPVGGRTMIVVSDGESDSQPGDEDAGAS